MLLALLVAASGAALIPASADGALVLEGFQGSAGIRALLETAGRRSATLSPGAVGQTLRDEVGVDLLAEQPAWGLDRTGARALVVMRGSVGLSAPVGELKSARAALDAWLGPSTRATRQKPLKGPRAAGDRAGMIAPVGGSRRLLVASGPHAAALVSALAHPEPFSGDRALLASATGPAWLYLRGRVPLRAAIFALDASSKGLVARGLVTSLRDPILQGTAPGPCEGPPAGCFRAGLGPAGREVLALALAELKTPPPGGPSVVVRFDRIDARRLTDERSLPRALHLEASDAPAVPGGPALSGELELTAVGAALAKLTPIDALRGAVAAGAYAGELLYGALLRNAGPLTVTGAPSGTAARIELHMPLH